jgi:hypothetical protein
MPANVSVEKGTTAAPTGVCSTATRRSVARTRRAFGGTAVAASTVVSESKGIRNYAGGVECNLPAIP